MVTWQDLTVADAPKLRDFYAAVVGWKFEQVSMQGYSDFSMIAPATGETVAGICHARGINAAIPPQWLIYITVEDVDAAAAKCKSLGGEIVVAPKPVGDGQFCVIRDPAGAICALYSPKSK